VEELPPEMFRHWVHSREEDTGGVQVYRPSDYAFPPARGRRGFEFRAGGEFVAYGPGPADKPQATVGRWEAPGPRRARVSTGAEPQELEIVSIEPDRLTLRWSEARD
jgi:hypothetical protein